MGKTWPSTAKSGLGSDVKSGGLSGAASRRRKTVNTKHCQTWLCKSAGALKAKASTSLSTVQHWKMISMYKRALSKIMNNFGVQDQPRSQPFWPAVTTKQGFVGNRALVRILTNPYFWIWGRFLKIWKSADREAWRSGTQSPPLKVRHPKTKLVRILEEARLYDEMRFIEKRKIWPRKTHLRMGSFRVLIRWWLRGHFEIRPDHFLANPNLSLCSNGGVWALN